jgi:hypothetical protein
MLHLVPYTTTLHLLVTHMYNFRCGEYHLRLPHSQTTVLVPDHCFSFLITWIPIQLLIYHLSISFLAFHLLLSKFLSPLCSSPHLVFHVDTFYIFSLLIDQTMEEGLLFLTEQLKKMKFWWVKLNYVFCRNKIPTQSTAEKLQMPVQRFNP